MYVSDTFNNRIQVFSPAGQLLNLFDPSEAVLPGHLAVDHESNILVGDSGGQVRKYTPTGAYLGVVETCFGPRGIAVSAAGRIAVVDGTNSQVLVSEPKRSTVSGRVFDSETGIPLSGKVVRLVSASDLDPGDSVESTATLTAADGSYSFDGVVGAYYRISMIDPDAWETSRMVPPRFWIARILA